MGQSIKVTTNTRVLESLIRASNGAPVRRVLHDGTEYGVYQEFGSGPHEIVARNAKALSWKGAAHPVKRVMHPGNPPHPFITPALESARPQIKKVLGPVLEQGASLSTAIDKIAFDALKVAKREAPYKTGNLQGSLMVEDAKDFKAD